MTQLALHANWPTTQRAMQQLSQKQARLALAVATTKTAQAIGQAARQAFAQEGIDDIPFRVSQIATPSRLQATLQADGFYEIDLPPPNRTRPTGQALRAMIAELQRTGRPIQRKPSVAIPHGKLWVKNAYADPTRYIGQGAFAMVTRANSSFNGTSNSTAAKQLGVLAIRLGARRLPVRNLGRLYAKPQTNFTNVAKKVAPIAFRALLTATLFVAYSKAGLPLASALPASNRAATYLMPRFTRLAA